MLMPRIYHPADLNQIKTLLITKDASHHLVNVLRLSLGDSLCLFNGNGNEYHAILREVNKRHALVEIISVKPVDRESTLRITLAQGIARGEKMDFIIQKAVELGVKRFLPLWTEFGNVKLAEERLEKRLRRWAAVIISASEQCGRNCLMELNEPVRFSAFLSSLKEKSSLNLLLSPSGDHTLSEVVSKSIHPSSDITLLIGSEGGFSESEIKQAQENHCPTLSFGKRILRTETAALAIVSALQSRWGDLK